jgi:hypothetical protein
MKISLMSAGRTAERRLCLLQAIEIHDHCSARTMKAWSSAVSGSF